MAVGGTETQEMDTVDGSHQSSADEPWSVGSCVGSCDRQSPRFCFCSGQSIKGLEKAQRRMRCYCLTGSTRKNDMLLPYSKRLKAASPIAQDGCVIEGGGILRGLLPRFHVGVPETLNPT